MCERISYEDSLSKRLYSGTSSCGCLSTVHIGGLRILQWNCRLILSAGTDLLYLISQQSPDVIPIQEPRLFADQDFHLNNYRCIRFDRPSRDGGLAFFISSECCHKAKNFTSDSIFRMGSFNFRNDYARLHPAF